MNHTPTRKEELEAARIAIDKELVEISVQVSYYLSLAQRKIDDIDKLEQVIYDLREEEASEDAIEVQEY